MTTHLEYDFFDLTTVNPLLQLPDVGLLGRHTSVRQASSFYPRLPLSLSLTALTWSNRSLTSCSVYFL